MNDASLVEKFILKGIIKKEIKPVRSVIKTSTQAVRQITGVQCVSY